MSVSLTGTGGLFTRLGKLGAALLAVNLFRGNGLLAINTLTGNGATTTVTTIRNHGLTTGDTVTVAGASISTANGSFSVTVTGNKTFTYASAANGTATGTMTARKTDGVPLVNSQGLVDNITGQFQTTDQGVVSDLYVQLASYQSAHSSYLQTLQQLAGTLLVQQVNEDTPLAVPTTTAAFQVLVSQMKTAGASVPKPTITATVSQTQKSAPVGLAVGAAIAGGSLTAATYYYKITGTDASGETLASSEANGTTAGGNLKLPLTWTALSGATGYRVYRGTGAGAENLLVQIVTSGATVAWTDDGTSTTYTAVLPASNTSGSNNGSAVCVASVLAGNGVQLDYLFPEALTVTATGDSQSGSTLSQEPFSIVGQAAESDSLMYDWPLGSGASSSLTAVDGSQSASGQNLLWNSGFDTFTVVNTPDNWTVVTGTVGTTVFSSGAGAAYYGANALQLTGTGAELTALTQQFNVSTGGTTSTLAPLTVYAVNAWVKVDKSPAAGVLALELVDGTPTIIQDANGINNAITLNLATLQPQIYLPLSGFFRTPAVLPAVQKFRVRLSTALDNTKSVFVDQLSLSPAVPAYLNGPYVQVFAGATKTIVSDVFTVTVSNKLDSQWQLLLERLFGMRALGIQIASSGSPTIADSLIP